MKILKKFNRGIVLLIVFVIAAITFSVIQSVNTFLSNRQITGFIREFYDDYCTVSVIPENVRNDYVSDPQSTYDAYEKKVKDTLGRYFHDELLLDCVTDGILLQFECNEYVDLISVGREDFEVMIIQHKDKVYYSSVSFYYNYSVDGIYDGTYNTDYVEFKKFEIVAIEMNFTYQYIVELHGYALQDFERTYENLLKTK